MINKAQDAARVNALKDGETTTVFWAEEGGGAVRRVGDMLELYEVPQYGGEPQYVNKYRLTEVAELLDEAYSWT